jgi:hypothetical protein
MVQNLPFVKRQATFNTMGCYLIFSCDSEVLHWIRLMLAKGLRGFDLPARNLVWASLQNVDKIVEFRRIQVLSLKLDPLPSCQSFQKCFLWNETGSLARNASASAF